MKLWARNTTVPYVFETAVELPTTTAHVPYATISSIIASDIREQDEKRKMMPRTALPFYG